MLIKLLLLKIAILQLQIQLLSLPPVAPPALILGALATSTAEERENIKNTDIANLRTGLTSADTSKANTYSGPRGSGTFTIYTKIMNNNRYQKVEATGPLAREFEYSWR